MIVTDRQLANAKAQADRFREALRALEVGGLNFTDLDPRLKAAQIDSVRADLTILESDIAEFERLRDGEVRSFDTDSLADLPRILIRARIAAGLTQRQLGERLGLKEPQIQRYEATFYEGASFSRMVDVADAIGLVVNKRLELIEPSDPQAVVKRLSAIGVDEGFLKRRITRDLDLDRDRESVSIMADRLGAIFEWSPRDIDVEGVFRELQHELIRHVFFHAEFDEKSKAQAAKLGRDGLRARVRPYLAKKISKANIYRDGTQTPKHSSAIHFAQHATATCCRKCVAYWHGIPEGHELTSAELDYCTGLVLAYLDQRMVELMAAPPGAATAPDLLTSLTSPAAPPPMVWSAAWWPTPRPTPTLDWLSSIAGWPRTSSRTSTA